ncbi:NYN domain-containing protein [Alcaligenaceae bacterium B3P038]|nr:NYN domain-containing protein [Alcaligenaceae bacterium B3P038]
MNSSNENVSMALFCDFENVALGVRDAQYEKFDIKPVLERLLLKGSIVVKKAYCDWERYKNFKATMHEANFELIEIPHVRQSGKNSADIRLVVDALDLCYTKSHVNTFVIISGDSDFSPLVSKLRENAKQVIGVGVKQSTSDLLIANCDEFIFYDDLVRESQHVAAKRGARNPAPAANKRPADADRRRKDDLDVRRGKAIDIAVETFDALVSERGDSGKIWASVLKEAIKRRKPDFNESYYGFRAFGNLLEEAQSRGLLEFGRDEKSGAYVYRANNAQGQGDTSSGDIASVPVTASLPGVEEATTKPESRRRTRGGRKSAGRSAEAQTNDLPRRASFDDEQDYQDPDYQAPVYQEPEYQAPAEQAYSEQDQGDDATHHDGAAAQDPWGEPTTPDAAPARTRTSSRRTGARSRASDRKREAANPFVEPVQTPEPLSSLETAEAPATRRATSPASAGRRASGAREDAVLPDAATSSDVGAPADAPARPERRPRRSRTRVETTAAAEVPMAQEAPAAAQAEAPTAAADAAPEASSKPIRKTPSRSRRPRKAAPAEE